MEIIIAHLGMQRDKSGKTWLAGYSLLLLLPWMLILSRGAADGITVAISLLFLWRSYQLKDWGWLSDNFLRLALVAWLWLIFASSPFSYQPLVSLGNALAWIRYIIFYAAIRHWLLTGRRPLLYLTLMLSALLAFCAVDTLCQYITGISLTGHKINESGRLSGPMNNVKVGIFLAKLLLPAGGLLLFFASKGSWRLIAASLCLLLLCYGVILLSGERTAFVVSSLGIFCAVTLLAVSDKKLRPICIALFALGILGSVVLLYTQNWVQERVEDTINTLSDFKHSSYGQLFWVGYELGKEHWLTGVGLKSFRELCLPYFAAGLVTYCDLHAHNLYIEWFAETGTVGLLLFVAMTGLLLREIIKFFRLSAGAEKIITATALATFIMNFWPVAPTQSFFSNWPAILLWFSVGLAFAGHNLLERTKT